MVGWSAEADAGELAAVSDEAADAVPDVTRLVDAPRVDQLGAVQDAHRPGRRQSTDVSGQLQRWHPAGELDVERCRREAVDGEQQRGRVECFVFGKREPPPQL